jgi:predicted nucleic acid-binding protein
MAGLFYDTNILLYAARHKLMGADAAKRMIAQELVADYDFMISGQVLSEFYANATKTGPHQLSSNQAEEWIDRLAIQPCIPIDASLVQSGIELANRYRINYWDAAIVAAAHRGDADLLYTEDLNDGQRYGEVTAINPFKNLAN